MKPPFPLPQIISIGLQEFTLASIHKDFLDEWHEIETQNHPFPWSRNNLRDSLNSHICLGLWQGTALQGYAVLSFVVGEAELLLFVIAEPLRGKGVGKGFLQFLLALCSPHSDNVFLEVRASNQSAIALYESCGFNLVGERANYYPKPSGGREDAFIYAITPC